MNCESIKTHYYRDIPYTGKSPELIAIEELQKEISILKNRKYIFIGDSYASGEIGSSWIDNCRAVLGEVNTYKYAKSGAGFTITGNTFQTLIEKAAADITDKSIITDVVVGGGYNDAIYSVSDDATKIRVMNTFVQYVQATFPNAKVHFAFIGWCIIPNNLKKLAKECHLWLEVGNGTSGADYLNNIQFALHRTDYFKGNHMNPTSHPSPAGNLYLSQCMLNCLQTGSCNVYHKITLKGTGISYKLLDAHVAITVTVENGTTIFECCHTLDPAQTSIFVEGSPTNTPITLNGYIGYDIISLDNFIGNNFNYTLTTTEAVIIDSSNKLYRIKAGMGVGNGAIYISPEINAATTGGDYANIVNIAFKGFKIVFDTMDCC